MLRCDNVRLLNKYPAERKKYEENFEKVSKEQVFEAKLKCRKILDMDTLTLISKFRIITSDAIAKVLYKDFVYPEKTANNHLRIMFKLGIVDRFWPEPDATAGSTPTHFILGPVGARILELDGFKRMKEIPQKWRHYVMVSDYYAYFVNKFKVLDWSNEYRLHYKNKKMDDQQIKADALIKTPDIIYLLELDTGSEAIQVLKDKIDAYGEYYADHINSAPWQPKIGTKVAPIILFVFKDEKMGFKLREYFIKQKEVEKLPKYMNCKFTMMQ